MATVGRKRGPGALTADGIDLSDAAFLDSLLQRGAKRLVSAAALGDDGDVTVNRMGALLQLAQDIITNEAAHRAEEAAAAAADSLSSAVFQEKGIFVSVMEYACGRVEDWRSINQVSKRWHELLKDDEERFLEGPLRLYPVGLHNHSKTDNASDSDSDSDSNEDECVKQDRSKLIFDGTFVRKAHMPSPESKSCQDPDVVSRISQVLIAASAEMGARRRRDFPPGAFNGFGMVLCPDGYVYRGSFVDGKREGRGTFIGRPHAGYAYEGKWRKDRQHGKGMQRGNLSEVFKGLFREGRKVGPGATYIDDGSIAMSWWVNDCRSGEGVYWSKDRTQAWKLSGWRRICEISINEATRITETEVGFESPI